MQSFIRFALLSVLAGSLLIAAGCQKGEEAVVVEGDVVVEEAVVTPVVEEAVVEVETEAEVSAEGEAAAQ